MQWMRSSLDLLVRGSWPEPFTDPLHARNSTYDFERLVRLVFCDAVCLTISRAKIKVIVVLPTASPRSRDWATFSFILLPKAIFY